MAPTARLSRNVVASMSLLALAACGDAFNDFDFDMRGSGGSAADTSDAITGIPGSRPGPDDRGVISYPDYQVAVAQRDDTVTAVANRVGVDPAELARFNGLPVDAPLRNGEVIVLPSRVAEPTLATGAITSGPITPGSVDITTLAGDAIDRSDDGDAAPVSGEQPIRHRVTTGETAFTIARKYNVPVEALAQWNGLGNDYAVRVDQFLLIPPVSFAAPAAATAGGSSSSTAAAAATTTAAVATTAPGQGTVAPSPPSAATALPETSPTPEPVETPPAPEMAEERTEVTDNAQFQMPVSGSIVRDYDADEFTGIGITASAGTPVEAADGGSVMLITRDTNQNAILVIRHSDELMTVYSGIDNITVERGDKVSRGQQVAAIKDGSPSSLFFQVRKGNETFDPLPYLQ
jgi:murein DD-endopeptidase MepM/ murein hydrolase activator NlpD